MNSTKLPRAAWVAGLLVALAACSVPPTPAPPNPPASHEAIKSPSTNPATASPRGQDTLSSPRPSPETLEVAPRPTVFIAGQNFYEVRTKLIPRVMGRGWTLLVNKNDSLEFFRPADSVLTTALFGIPPEPGQRIRLRFRLVPEGNGTWIALMGHLMGKNGELPAIAYAQPLVANLAALQEDLLAAPTTQAPQKGGKKRK